MPISTPTIGWSRINAYVADLKGDARHLRRLPLPSFLRRPLLTRFARRWLARYAPSLSPAESGLILSQFLYYA